VNVTDFRNDEFKAFVFKNRGALLALPAAILAAFGKPSAFSIAAGLPLAFFGEAIRCWAVGYSGVTTRDDEVVASKLITAGPYAHVRNPLYIGNFATALGFACAFTGRNDLAGRVALIVSALGVMAGVYAIIIPHEEQYLRSQFGARFDRYCERVPRIVPRLTPAKDGEGSYDPSVIPRAESRTFATFGAMLAILALKALRA